MGIQEEKEWLRAILEGRVKPGDTDWQRVCMDTDFAGLRRHLRLIGEMGLEERQADLQAIWRNIESVRNKNRAVRRLRILRRVAYSAACIAGFAVSAAIFFLKEKTEYGYEADNETPCFVVCFINGKQGKKFVPEGVERKTGTKK